MSTITNNQITLAASLLVRFQVCEGFIKSLLAMFLTFLIPSCKPTLPHYTRRAHPSRRRRARVAQRRRSTTPSPSPMQRTVTCPVLPLRGESPTSERPRISRHVSFHLSSPSALLSRSQTLSHLSRRLSFSKHDDEDTESTSDSSRRSSQTSSNSDDSDYSRESFSSNSTCPTEPEFDGSYSPGRPSSAGLHMPSMKKVFSMSRRSSAASFWEDPDSDEDSSWQSSPMRRARTGMYRCVLFSIVPDSD